MRSPALARPLHTLQMELWTADRGLAHNTRSAGVTTITRDGKMSEAWATAVCECSLARIDAGVDQKVAIQACVKAQNAVQQDKPAAETETEAAGR